MPNGHGGNRTPNDPAAVSGPGALSQRTDGGASQAPQVAPGNGYGERKAMLDIQGGAPMQGGGLTRDMLPPLDAPSARPGEPVTAGADLGAGISAGAAGITSIGPTQIDDATRERLLGALPVLMFLASQPKASEQTRQFVRSLRGDL